MLLWSTLVVSPSVLQSEPPLRRSFYAGGQLVLLLSAGLVFAWPQPDICGFRLVLARGWHGLRRSLTAKATKADEPRRRRPLRILYNKTVAFLSQFQCQGLTP